MYLRLLLLSRSHEHGPLKQKAAPCNVIIAADVRDGTDPGMLPAQDVQCELRVFQRGPEPALQYQPALLQAVFQQPGALQYQVFDQLILIGLFPNVHPKRGDI